MSAPALLVCIPLLTGAALGLLGDGLDPGLPGAAAAGALFALMAALAALLQRDLEQACAAAIVGAFLAGLSLGVTAAADAYHPRLLHWFDARAGGEGVEVEGVLREDAVRTPTGVSLTLDVRRVAGRRDPTPGGVRLSVGGSLAEREVERWRAGRSIRAPVFLRRPSVYLDPGVPDERRSLARRGIALVGTVKSGALIEVTRQGTAIAERAAAIRAFIRSRISAHMDSLDRRSAGVTTAVLIGDRSGLAIEDERRLQEAGTYHVIAISGGNIAILAVVLVSACRVLLVPSPAAAILTASLLIFYGVIAAGAASVSRAVTVAVVVLAARAMDHRGIAVNTLAIAAVLAIAVEPAAVLDVGFMLSFGATAGIVIGVPLVVGAGRLPRSPFFRVARQLVQGAARLGAATVCAEIVIAPVGAAVFSRVTFAGLLLNFAAIPLMTLVQLAGLAVVAASPVSTALAGHAARVADLGADGLLWTSRLVEVAPWLSVSVRPPAWWVVSLYYTCGLALLEPRVRRLAAVLLSVCGASILGGFGLTSRDAVPPSIVPLRIVVLDVGQGDATVLQLPGGRALLVDTGGIAGFSSPDSQETPPVFDIGERVVSPALRALGIDRLDGLVITHGDPDHSQGTGGVLRSLPAAGIWEGVPVPPHSGLQALAALARARGTAWRTVQAGDSERHGEVEIRVLHPPLPGWERQRVRNEDSIVLEVRVGEVSVILPGDIGREGERAILPRLEPGRLVVLKAPHHGSNTSSTKELLERLRPAAVVFSCGRDNRFGHPHPAVVERYRTIGAEIFSTAEDGAVFVETDGRTVAMRAWTGRRTRLIPTKRD